jgi:phosphoglycerate dehydrogenase-like enzyme
MITLALYHKLQEQIIPTQTEKRWPSDKEVGGQMFIQELRTKTVGILGYGHVRLSSFIRWLMSQRLNAMRLQIGRESARLAKAFGAKIIAANTSGKQKAEDGYIVPGTGDPDGR